MNGPIDLILAYVDSSDPKWQEEYFKYKTLENIDEQNEQTNPEIRFRDTGTLRYIFRSIENNLSWCRYVFFVVQNERQIPFWLDRNNPKLKIVYHKDYIPEDLLPTFNSNTIEFFYYRIPELANNFIILNDDTFALNPVPETFFFENDKVVYDKQPSGERPPVDMFNIMMRNNQNIIKQLTGIGDQWFVHRHQMVPHKKDLERQIIEPNLDVFKTCFSSKFRDYKNVTPWLFNELSKVANLGVNKPGLYNKSALVELNSKVDLKMYNNYELVCINDTKKNDNFELTKKRMQDFLYDKFPEPSKYEQKLVINYFANAWIFAEPGQWKQLEPKTVEWRKNVVSPFDVYIDTAIPQVRNDGRKKVALLVESGNHYKIVHDWLAINNNWKKFNYIFTFDLETLKLPNAIRMIWGGIWLETEGRPKTKNISFCCTNKRMIPSHLERIRLADMIHDKVDMKGNYLSTPATTADIYEDYRYSIVFECENTPYYFSEKLLNAFVRRCIPINYGCTDLASFGFDTSAVLQCNTIQDVVDLVNSDFDWEGFYNSHLDAIEYNRKLSFKYCRFEDRLMYEHPEVFQELCRS